MLYTQTLSGQCIENPFASTDCASVTLIEDVFALPADCYITGSEVSTAPQPVPLCPDVPNSAAQNISWVGFVAPAGNYALTISSSNCTLGDGAMRGIQVGIYTDCTFQDAIFCDANCSEGDKVLNSDLFTEGEDYYLFIDGCTSSICEYRLRFDPSPDDVCVVDGMLALGTPTDCEQHTPIASSSFTMQTTCAKDWDQCEKSGLTQWHEISVTDASTKQILTYVTADGFDPVWSVYAGLSLETSSPVAASNFGDFASTTCSSSDGDPSNSHIVPVSSDMNTRYWIAVSATSTLIDSSYTIDYAPLLDCTDCVGKSTTNFYSGQIQTLIDGVATDGPFAPGQEVQICVDYLHEGNLWIHGMIPNFGPGWEVPAGGPSLTNTNLELVWYESEGSCSAYISGYDVPNLYTYEEDGQLKIRHTLETPQRTSAQSLADGSPLPSGWFVTTTGSTSTCNNSCSPSTNFGEPQPLQASFCFDLTVRSDIDIDAAPADALQIEMLPTTDLISGCWVQDEPCLDIMPFVSRLWTVSCAAFVSDVEEVCLDGAVTLSSPLDVEWSTTNAEICTVSAAGIVTPVAPGTCTVVAINILDDCQLTKDIEILDLEDTACLGTATEEATIISTVYPNPTSDILHLTADTPIRQVSVSTMSGKVVVTEQINDTRHRLDLGHLPTGLYIVELRIGDQSIMEKVVVTN